MATVHDVAAYILKKRGRMSAMRMQKLVYYSQAWSLVWDDRPLFQERIEAWANGPVVPELFEKHRGKFELSRWPLGNPDVLNSTEQETVDIVLDFYASHNAQWLSDLTHREDPWRDARKGLPEGERGNRIIKHSALQEYYANLARDE